MNGEGARIVEEAKAGLSVSAEDPEALANAILDMYQMNDIERLQLGENGRAYFKANYDEDTLINGLVKNFKSLIIRDKN